MSASPEALRFAIRFLAHLIWVDSLFGVPAVATAEPSGDFGIELAVILTAAARTAPDSVWPPDLPRSGDLGRAFAARLEAMAARVAAQKAPRLEAALGMATLACQRA